MEQVPGPPEGHPGGGPDHQGDEIIRVTMHHNWYANTGERHPRCRFGKVHSFNNLLTGWRSYGAGASMRVQFLSEANIYSAGAQKDAVLAQALGADPDPGYARSVGDLLLNGARIMENEPDRVFDPADLYAYKAETADTALRARIEAGAGWRDVLRPR